MIDRGPYRSCCRSIGVPHIIIIVQAGRPPSSPSLRRRPRPPWGEPSIRGAGLAFPLNWKDEMRSRGLDLTVPWAFHNCDKLTRPAPPQTDCGTDPLPPQVPMPAAAAAMPAVVSLPIDDLEPEVRAAAKARGVETVYSSRVLY